MNILLPQPIEPEAVQRLTEAGHDIVTAPDPKPETIMALIGDARAVILRTGLTMTRGLIDAADNLMVIARTGGGFDNVDIAAATQKEVIVTSNLGVNSISVCEHVLAMMLALSKKLMQLDRAVRSGNYQIRYRNLSRDLHGKTLGLLGFGRIGSQVAAACRTIFDMQVLACDPFLPEQVRDQHKGLVRFVDKERLCAESDVISVHVPLTDETRQALSTPEFALMKPDAIVINTSRGAVIDEQALITALENKIIGGAGLDVQDREPPEPGNRLLELDQVILTPHSAALTGECVIRMATEAADRVIEVLSGRVPLNVANPEVLAAPRWRHLS